MAKFLKWWGENKSKASFMSFIGGLFVVAYVLISFYQFGQINYFLAKGKITGEVYERMVNMHSMKLVEIVMIIVLFFFKDYRKTDSDEVK